MRWDGALKGSMSLPPGANDFWGPVPMAETESFFLTVSEMTGRDFPAGPVVRTPRFHALTTVFLEDGSTFPVYFST